MHACTLLVKSSHKSLIQCTRHLSLQHQRVCHTSSTMYLLPIFRWHAFSSRSETCLRRLGPSNNKNQLAVSSVFVVKHDDKFKIQILKTSNERRVGEWVGDIWGTIGRRMRNFDGDSKTEIWTSIPNLLEHIFEKVYRKQIYFQHSKERETTHM